MDSELTILLTYGLVVAALLALKTTGMMGQLGMGYMLSARDEPRALEGMLGRLNRALDNSVTALALVSPPLVIIGLTDSSTGESLIAAQAFLVARVAYIPAYAFGIRGLRTLVWLGGFAATVILYFLAL